MSKTNEQPQLSNFGVVNLVALEALIDYANDRLAGKVLVDNLQKPNGIPQLNMEQLGYLFPEVPAEQPIVAAEPASTEKDSESADK